MTGQQEDRTVAGGSARHRVGEGAGWAWLDAVPDWWVALPDCAAAAPVAARLRECAADTVPHPSGRTWLLGRWGNAPGGAETLRVGAARDARIAVAGQHAVTVGELERIAASSTTPAEAARRVERMPGSFHLLASVGGRVRAQGSLSGLRRVFTARLNGELGGVTVAADRADVLAWLMDGGPELDVPQLAFHLLDPPALHPLTDRPLWSGVAHVPPGHCVVLGPDGTSRQERRWTPPAPEVPLAEGARAVREALAAGVEARTRGRDRVSADLSGLDSTAVCCLAARGEGEGEDEGAGGTGVRVLAFTAASPDPLDDDVAWARRTAAAVPGIEHRTVPADEMPQIYSGLPELDDPFDEPCGVIADHARWSALARRGAALGSAVHFGGFGGDEVLAASTSHLRLLLRRRPTVALPLLRGFAASYRWPRSRVLRQLGDARPYPVWLRAAADLLTAPPPPANAPSLDWGSVPRMPPWATGAAVDAVRELVLGAAAEARLITEHRGLHDDLEGIRYAARPLRPMGQLALRGGTALAAPFHDDLVLEAALAVRAEEKRTPWRYKPLLLEGMRGVVPEVSLGRQTKSAGTCDPDTALRENRAALLSLWEDSRLARLGLADAATLRVLCAGPLQDRDGGRRGDLHGALYQAVACEVWLRAREAAASGAREYGRPHTVPTTPR
ncbi:asparagine synthase-related protein [Streptomyces sp. NPDC048172]|uniref:asparagine synthase-related protein n=1 Tax=Streptomyces sp. NPDC048172 TaxID=3365505 RepID=UPI0037123118